MNEFQVLDQKKESFALVAGFLVVAVIGVYTLYIRQSAIKVELLAENDKK